MKTGHLLGCIALAAICAALVFIGLGKNDDAGPEKEAAQVSQTAAPSAAAASIQPSATEEAAAPTATPAEPVDAAAAPVYLDEGAFLEKERPLIALINKRMQYLYEDNFDEYIKLILEESPVYPQSDEGFPRFKVLTASVIGPISIQEQKKVFEAIVTVEETRNNGEIHTNTFVFLKDKSADVEWKIIDID